MGMIYVTGDLHGDFSRLGSRRLRATDQDYVIVCGDFGGLWDGSNSDTYWLRWLDEKPFVTLFADGNHENYDLLEAYPVEQWHGGRVQRIGKHILHLMRGEIYDIDGRSFFVMGGAECHDVPGGVLDPEHPDFMTDVRRLSVRRIQFRIKGQSWWEHELPTAQELSHARENLARHGNRVDYIITHCAPTSVQRLIADKPYPSNSLTDFFDELLLSCDFKRWFFGHYHKDRLISERLVLLYENMVSIENDGLCLEPEAFSSSRW